MIAYHDDEWGVPLHDDRKWFEFLTLDAFQAGLSWSCILNKREAFRIAFAEFDPERIVLFTEDDVERLMQDKGIVRNRAKIRATITNATAFLRIQAEFGTFDAYIWTFTNGLPIVNKWEALSQIPARSEVSDTMSKALVKRGFKFVGSTICYAFMQAAGMVNDHLADCECRTRILEKTGKPKIEETL
jgi:DNA-3-methyladenine glycosylase I